MPLNGSLVFSSLRYSGLNAGLIAACGKERQSITPGFKAGGLTSIVGAAAKHHSPIICDSLRAERSLGVPSATLDTNWASPLHRYTPTDPFNLSFHTFPVSYFKLESSFKLY